MLIVFNSDHQNGDAKSKIVLYPDINLNEQNDGKKIRMNEGKLYSIETSTVIYSGKSTNHCNDFSLHSSKI